METKQKTYTEEELRVFTQLYLGNFSATCIAWYEIDNKIKFNWQDFQGQNFGNKLRAFNKTIKQI